MTQRILREVTKLLYLIINSDKFIRVFTAKERDVIRSAYDAIESASHYPD